MTDKMDELIRQINALTGELEDLVLGKQEKPKWENPILWAEGFSTAGIANELKHRQWSEAMLTLRKLHACDGVEPVVSEKTQYLIGYNKTRDLEPLFSEGYGFKAAYWSPCFATKEQAKAAINRVGEDRIKQMANILSGVWDE